jgi:hypothetical protein
MAIKYLKPKLVTFILVFINNFIILFLKSCIVEIDIRKILTGNRRNNIKPLIPNQKYI